MRTLLLPLILAMMLPCVAQRPIAELQGKFFKKGGNKMLYGGKSDSNHFVINNLELHEGQFHYGLGREHFPALIAPEFESVREAAHKWQEDDRFLVAYKGNDVRAYSVRDLTRHEVVNDVIAGEPVFAAYCILADLGAIYKRTYSDSVFTFAVSGYTYYDPEIWNGLDGFILWDRETESLWWPLIDKAVSGDMKGMPLIKLEDAFWEDTNWRTIKNKFPEAKVLISNQDFERPPTWNEYKDVSDIVEKYSN